MQSCRSYPAATFTRSATDPLNLVGILTPGDRRAGGNTILHRNGIPLAVRDTLRVFGDSDPETGQSRRGWAGKNLDQFLSKATIPGHSAGTWAA